MNALHPAAYQHSNTTTYTNERTHHSNALPKSPGGGIWNYKMIGLSIKTTATQWARWEPGLNTPLASQTPRRKHHHAEGTLFLGNFKGVRLIGEREFSTEPCCWRRGAQAVGHMKLLIKWPRTRLTQTKHSKENNWWVNDLHLTLNAPMRMGRGALEGSSNQTTGCFSLSRQDPLRLLDRCWNVFPKSEFCVLCCGYNDLDNCPAVCLIAAA